VRCAKIQRYGRVCCCCCRLVSRCLRFYNLRFIGRGKKPLAHPSLLPLSPTDCATDSKSAKDLSYNPEHHNRTKHVERRHFFIRDMVEKFELRVPLVSTVNNYADFFTKPLKSKAFFGLRNKIMNIA